MRFKSFSYLSVFLASVVGIFSVQKVHGALDMTITKGNINPIPIAIPRFDVGSGGSDSMAQQIHGVISDDLKNCGLFNVIPESSHIQNGAALQAGPDYSAWRLIKADNVVAAKVLAAPGGGIRVEFRVFDTIRQVQIEGKAFMGPEKEWRRLAHKVADAIYERLIGDAGYFDTQIVYVARTEGQDMRKRVKRTERLAIMDQDGANHRYMTDGRTLVMSPRFSPDMKTIAFMDFGANKPRVYLFNRENNRTTLVGHFAGMTFAPGFSPDGNRLALSFASKGNTSLYEMDLRTMKIIRLTNEPVIDTSPSFSPDGTQIVFNSDRSGLPHLYVMNSMGGPATRISYGNGNYRTPMWSPRGDLIAFTKMYGGEFYIGVMRPDGSGERLLTRGFLVEGPAWCPNGRVILYTREEAKGQPYLYSIDVTGFNERKIPTPGFAIQGSWSNKR